QPARAGPLVADPLSLPIGAGRPQPGAPAAHVAWRAPRTLVQQAPGWLPWQPAPCKTCPISARAKAPGLAAPQTASAPARGTAALTSEVSRARACKTALMVRRVC